MTSPPSIINNQTAKQCCLKQDEMVSLFTRAKKLQKKVRFVQLFDEPSKVLHPFYGNEPFGNELDLSLIQYQTIDHAYAGTTCPRISSGLEDSHFTFGYLVSGGMYVWNKRMLVLNEGKAGIQSRKRLAHVDAFCSSHRVRATSVPSDVHSTKLESPVPVSGFMGISKAGELLQLKVDTAG